MSGKFLNIIDQTLRQIISGSYVRKNAQKQHFWLFLIKETIKNIPKQFLLENNITHQLKTDGGRIILSKVSDSSFSDDSCSCSFKILNAVLLILKIAHFNLRENA